MDALSFGSPELAWTVLVAMALAGLAWWRRRRAAAALARLGRGPVLARLVATCSPRRWWLREGLALAALVLLAAAATRPRYGLRETEVANAGIDIAFVVDASRSMLVRDIVPNRLQGTSLEISALLDRLAGGRVALVPFAGIPFVQCPLTTDHEVIRTYLAELRTDDMPVGGSNIGRAITAAADVLTGQAETAEAALRDNLIPAFKGSKHKAIVIFSDGEDHDGEPVEAAKRAAAQGIRVFTVGVGSAFGDPVPIIAGDGTVTGTLKDEQGNPIFSKLDLARLEAIAAASGGRSFHYANKSVVPELFAALDGLEKAEYRDRFQMLGADRYQWLLGPALALLLLALALGERSGGGRSRAAALAEGLARQQDTVAPAVLAALCVAAVALSPAWASAADDDKRPATAAATPPRDGAPAPAAAGASDAAAGKAEGNAGQRAQSERRRDPSWLDRENPDVRDGREALAAGRHGDGRAAFERAQQSRPEHAILWYDLGLALSLMSQHKDAAVALDRCLSALAERDPELEADLHYAAGTNQLLWGQAIERAKAAEAATNAGGGPPPAAPPTSPAAGTAGSPPSGAAPPAPSAAPAGDDPAEHYRLAVESLQKALLAAPARADVRRNLELAVLAAYPPCEHRDKAMEPNDQPATAQPLELAADQKEASAELRLCPLDRDIVSLDLEPGDRLSAKIVAVTDQDKRATDPLLGDPPSGVGGMRLLLTDATGGEILRGAPAPEPPLQTVDLTQVERAARVLVDIRNDAGVEQPYRLEVKRLPACQRLEDKLEPNDTPATARAVAVGQPVPLRLCPRNDDHLAVQLDAGQGLVVKAERKLDLGADSINIEVLDGAGAVLTQGVRQGEQWLARMAYAPVSGPYIVRVRGGLDTEADVTVQLEVTPPCVMRDDPWEDNDQPLAANPMERQDITAPLEGMQLCPGDDDWYRVDLAPGESLVVDLAVNLEGLPDVAALAGALTVTVYDDKGEIWGQARGGPVEPGAKGLARTTAVLAPPAGPYYVRVAGGGVADAQWPLPELPADAQRVETDPPAPAEAGAGGGAGPGAGPGGITATPLGPSAGGPAAPAGTPPDKPRKVRRVLLPSGPAGPAVDLGLARLDAPYRLGLRIVPACPEGNDEREPDNSAGEAKRVEVGQEVLGRVCKADVDWIEVPQKAGQSLQVTARYDFSHGALELKATDEAGVETVAEGQTQAPALPGGAPDADTPAARRGRTAISGVQIPAPKQDRVVKVQLRAAQAEAENFYFLAIQEPPPPSDQPDKQPQGGGDDQDDKQDDADKSKEEQEKKDKDGKQDQPSQAEQDQRDAQRAQMQRHDRNPRNLEAQEAMRKSPFRNTRPAKDW